MCMSNLLPDVSLIHMQVETRDSMVKLCASHAASLDTWNPITGLSANAVTNQRAPSKTVGRAMSCAAYHVIASLAMTWALGFTKSTENASRSSLTSCHLQCGMHVLSEVEQHRCPPGCTAQMQCNLELSRSDWWCNLSGWRHVAAWEWIAFLCAGHIVQTNGISWAEFKTDWQVADMLQQKGVLLDWQLSTQWHKSCLGGFPNWMP